VLVLEALGRALAKLTVFFVGGREVRLFASLGFAPSQGIPIPDVMCKRAMSARKSELKSEKEISQMKKGENVTGRSRVRVRS
jgi:hypothetical protein